MADRLCELGVEVNQSDQQGNSPLWVALRSKQEAIAAKLVGNVVMVIIQCHVDNVYPNGSVQTGFKACTDVLVGSVLNGLNHPTTHTHTTHTPHTHHTHTHTHTHTLTDSPWL